MELRDDGVIISHKCLPNIGEVLTLTQYSEPDQDGSGHNGHLNRAFSAATLIRAGVDEANGRNSNSNFGLRDSMLIQFIRSVISLGPDAIAPAVQLLAWCVLQNEADKDMCTFLAFGVLLLEATKPHTDKDEHWLRELTEWVIATEAVDRSDNGGWVNAWDTRWLVGLNYYDRQSDQTFAEHWRSTALHVLVQSEPSQPRRVSDAFFALADRISAPRP